MFYVLLLFIKSMTWSSDLGELTRTEFGEESGRKIGSTPLEKIKRENNIL